MTAQIYNLRDFQSEKDRVRIAKMAAEILSQIDTGDELYRSQLGQSKPYQAPPEDCA
jgi:hypothetical protein